jgi:NAD(P)-dependent dehydrogenase (short-subunit alcohol dehydrogenase family)
VNQGERKAADSSVLVVGVGAWQGLGAAIARRFAKGGHPVVIAGRNTHAMSKSDIVRWVRTHS